MWFWYALATAVLWGVCYAITAFLSKNYSGSAVMFLCYLIALPFFGLVCYKRGAVPQLAQLIQWPNVGWIVLSAICLVAANLLIFKAFQLSPNPFWVNIVEISFPLFTVLFSYLLFRMGFITPASLAGFAFIMVGLAIIYKMQ